MRSWIGDFLDEGNGSCWQLRWTGIPEYAYLKMKLKKAGFGLRDIERAVKQTRALLYQATPKISPLNRARSNLRAWTLVG